MQASENSSLQTVSNEENNKSDSISPVIIGVKDLTTVQGMPVNLLKGITAEDSVGKNLTNKVKVSNVNFALPGNQPIVYSVTDEYGNKTIIKADLTVIEVEDKSRPEFQGVKNLIINKGEVINVLDGVSVNDNVDGDLTEKIKVSKFNINKVGHQTITYKVTDKAGNEGESTADLLVLDKKLTNCNKKAYVIVRQMSILDNASERSKTIKKVDYLGTVTISATIKNNDFVQVKLSNGKIGYCLSSSVSSKKPIKKNKEDVPGEIFHGGIPSTPQVDAIYSMEQMLKAASIWAKENKISVIKLYRHFLEGDYFEANDGYKYRANTDIAGKIVDWEQQRLWRIDAYELFGVTNTKYYNKNVTLNFANKYLADKITINGKVAHLKNRSITIEKEGTYTVKAQDKYGQVSTVRFYIDKTKPKIIGMVNGKTYKSDSIPVTFSDNMDIGYVQLDNIYSFKASNPHINDGAMRSWETEFASEWDGTFTLTVADKAGNTTTVKFKLKYWNK